jgi:alkyldihydroxyacetonephosphate synthase
VTLAGAPGAVGRRFDVSAASVPEATRARIGASGVEVADDEESRLAAARDWWPLSLGWAVDNVVPAAADLVARPKGASEVAAVLAACSEAAVPVTPLGGRSGVCGGSVPVFGGVALDLTAIRAPLAIDEVSLVADVPAGLFGDELEAALRACPPGYTLGHWPQSVELSTVGGWLACRGAGQYSTRYGKIEDMVVGLDVVLADGRVVRTEGRGPRSATGPSLTQLFVGSEGTLGVITSGRLRIRPTPAAEARRAFGFASFADGLDACRRILRRGATPAVLRLYDAIESSRHFEVSGTCVLVVLDEADPALLAATTALVEEECRGAALAAGRGAALDPGLVDRWWDRRNDVAELGPLWQAGVVVDTAEVAGPWGALAALADDVLDGLRALPGTLVASVHQSHAYTDGACLYFTFAGRGPDDAGPDWRERYYLAAWDRLSGAALERGAALSHHHGIGINRARFMAPALGAGLGVLQAIKDALDPAGVLNPGKLGLRSPFGAVPWP